MANKGEARQFLLIARGEHEKRPPSGGLISLDSNRLVLKNDDNQEIPFYAE
jgi:hypothetical protein